MQVSGPQGWQDARGLCKLPADLRSSTCHALPVPGSRVTMCCYCPAEDRAWGSPQGAEEARFPGVLPLLLLLRLRLDVEGDQFWPR